MEKKITIKNKWSEITINEYIQIIGILKDESLDELEINNYLLSILSGLDIKDVRKLSIQEYNNFLKASEFLKKQPSTKLKKSYIINNKKYNTTLKLSKVNTGQYMDLQELTKDYESTIENISKILAIFLIPDGKEYGDYDILEVANEIENYFNIEDAVTLTFFFSNLKKKLLIVSLLYLEKMKKKAEKNLNKKKKK